MLDDDALRVAGRPRGIDDVASSDRPAARPRPAVRRVSGFASMARFAVSRRTRRTSNAPSSRAEAGHRYDGLDARVRQDEANALRRETRVERHIGGVDLHHRQQRDDRSRPILSNRRPTRSPEFDPLVDQVAGDLVGALVEVAIGDDGVVGDDRVVRPEAPTGLLQEMMKPLALLPTNGAVLAGQYRGPSDRSFEASGRDGQVMDASEMRDAVRRGCRATRRSCLSQWAKREPLRHCTTLDAADPARAQKCAQRPEPSTAVAPSAGSAWRSLLRRATVTFLARSL